MEKIYKAKNDFPTGPCGCYHPYYRISFVIDTEETNPLKGGEIKLLCLCGQLTRRAVFLEKK